MKKNSKYIQPHRTPRTTIGIKANTKENWTSTVLRGNVMTALSASCWRCGRNHVHMITIAHCPILKALNNTPTPCNQESDNKGGDANPKSAIGFLGISDIKRSE